jgi:hypothetical protein
MRRTVGWSSMTRILGALRTSGRVTVAARRSIEFAGPLGRIGVLPGCNRRGLGTLYAVGPCGHCDPYHTRSFAALLGFGSTLFAILESGAALIVLGPGGRETPELEVTLV